jgi:hypothetical protein
MVVVVLKGLFYFIPYLSFLEDAFLDDVDDESV